MDHMGPHDASGEHWGGVHTELIEENGEAEDTRSQTSSL